MICINHNYLLIQNIADLHRRGFILDFTFYGDKVLCSQDQVFTEVKDCSIDERFVFTNAHSNKRVKLLTIEVKDTGKKGILLQRQ